MAGGTSVAARTACLVLASCTAAAAFGAAVRARTQSGDVDAAQIARGKQVYAARKCQTCHMVAGKGNIRFPLDGVGRRLREADIRLWLTETARMEAAMRIQPAIRMSEWLASKRAINDADREALVAYLVSLK